MGAQWSRFGKELSDFTLAGTSTLSEKSSDRRIAKIQKLVLDQYPYLSNIQEAMVVADCAKPDCPLIYVNDAFEKMTLHPKEEIVNRNCRFLQGPHTNQDTVAKIKDALVNEKPVEVEILNYRKDGVAFWNNFLMLPVFKGKKCRYSIAIQKNITVLKQGNSPTEWAPEEVAMWLEYYGIASFAQKIIQNQIDGKTFLRLTRRKVLHYGFILRSEQEDILKASAFLQQNIEKPFAAVSDETNDTYSPNLNESVNYSVDLRKPSELNYWETSGTPSDTILFKAYYNKEIFLFLWPKYSASLEIIKTEICNRFGLKSVRLSHVNFVTKESFIVYTDSAFKDLLEKETGTVKFYVEEEERDLLSLTSVLYFVPDGVMIVNGLLHILFTNAKVNEMLAVKNSSFLWNATQYFPELPLKFADHSHINTIMNTPNGDVLVEISVTAHRDSLFMFIIRPVTKPHDTCTTKSFKIEQSANSKKSEQDPEKLQPSASISSECESGVDVLVGEMSLSSTADSSDLSDLRGESSSTCLSNSTTPKVSKPNLNAEMMPVFKSGSLPTVRMISGTITNRTQSCTPTIPMIEGDTKELRRTLDQLLFGKSQHNITMFICSYKMFHTKQTLLEEILSFVTYYYDKKTLQKTKETNLYDDLTRNFAHLLEVWTDTFPSDFNSSAFRKMFLSLLDKIPNAQAVNAIKLKMIKGLKQSDENDSLSSQVSLVCYTSASDIANALTAMDKKIFNQIKAKEFYRCAWMKENKDQTSPNLVALSASFENITNWVSKSILVQRTKLRAKIIQKLINVAQCLLRLNNFHTMMAIVSALDLVHISRMKKTWAIVSQQSMSVLHDIQDLMNSSNNFRNYRKVLQDISSNCSSFAIPYMPIILRDMTYTYEAISKDCTKDNVEIMGKQLSLILQLQKRDIIDDEYSIKESLLHYFETYQATTGEEEFYQLSTKLEPILTSSASTVLL